MIKTYQQVYPQVYVFPVWGGSRVESTVRNIIVIGSTSSIAPNWSALQATAADASAALVKPSNIEMLLSARYTKAIQVDDVPILTDDYAPVDILMHW